MCVCARVSVYVDVVVGVGEEAPGVAPREWSVGDDDSDSEDEEEDSIPSEAGSAEVDPESNAGLALRWRLCHKRGLQRTYRAAAARVERRGRANLEDMARCCSGIRGGARGEVAYRTTKSQRYEEKGVRKSRVPRNEGWVRRRRRGVSSLTKRMGDFRSRLF